MFPATWEQGYTDMDLRWENIWTVIVCLWTWYGYVWEYIFQDCDNQILNCNYSKTPTGCLLIRVLIDTRQAFPAAFLDNCEKEKL